MTAIRRRILGFWRTDCREVVIVYNAQGVFTEFPDMFQISDRSSLRKLFNLVGNDGSKAFPFTLDSFVGDNVELSEGDDKQFLKVGDGSDSRIRVVGMSRLANGRKVASHQIDEHAIVRHLQELLAIDLEYSYMISRGQLGIVLCSPRPIWNRTLTPIAKTQSTIRKAKIKGIELMYKLRNHLKLAHDLALDLRQRRNRELHVD